ncbi:arsenical pump-driving ATPase [Aliarcobacter cryaerophilus]|uniref:arsenite-transporting ATPase n=2 Tax=unclassified Arcobacter TaxID=2593671 RepID=A0AA96IAK0_9BACT|nr:arsenical pump-driving ATPase [Arcobacter sp. AZ-2023]WPD10422.1 arsenical pump-driving ATPase [Arcobacter sp. DSM 115954]WNL15252.1 arsenical pump-driving ATPase [Arcobacter sp. AZ-2023]WNL18866.1 arsenical pump-driving ATPase [Arcobacter sp. AZ-2023]WNL21005.1 arsenical pump-driving ATPase [Arcobacter sp. AZ-2023]
MKDLIKKIPQFLFFTGKGGVGKTSMSCAISVALAKEGKKVLLISTDPASNLDEVLDTNLKSTPTKVNGVENLDAMNINPVVAAHEYKEKMVAPFRGVLPQTAIEQMEEQLSGACTVEIAGFNEFSKYVGDDNISKMYDHIVLDTAPTGHTLRLLKLPSAWNTFIEDNDTGTSCLGAVSGLSENKKLYENVVENLKNKEKTLLILVSRAEELSLIEASKASKELAMQGINNQHLIVNGLFTTNDEDQIAKSFENISRTALENIDETINSLSKTIIGFYPNGAVGIEALESIIKGEKPNLVEGIEDKLNSLKDDILKDIYSWNNLIDNFEKDKNGLIMTMGKGGVGKTTIASDIALSLAKRNHKVILSTTDPASHLEYVSKTNENLTIEKIDPKIETQKHVNEVIAQNEGKISPEDMALLKEELTTPCIEEIAVFKAFAKTVDKAKDSYVVLDTAPTGHTLLLLDASQAYHKEILKNQNDAMEKELLELLPRIKDEKYTKILLVTLPEATPTHEAKDLQEDLKRAGIKPYAWIVNRSFALTNSSNNLLCQKALNEIKYINEIKENLSSKTLIRTWINN